ATLSACSAGIAVAYQILGTHPDFAVSNLPTPGLSSLLFYAGFGVPLGFLGVAYNWLITRGLAVSDRFTGARSDLAAAAIGGAIGLAAWFLPTALGSGDEWVQSVLKGGAALTTLLGLLLVRFAIGPIAYAAGTPGGLFS